MGSRSMVEQSSDPRRSGGQLYAANAVASEQLVEYASRYTPKKRKIATLCQGSSGPE